jgi:class 3 adenylate cyclase
MRRLLPALLRSGADPRDDEDERLRKLLVLAAALMVLPAGLLWGVVYWIFGEPLAAVVPWTYATLSCVSIGMFAATRTYRWFATSQFVPFLVLPFALMWTLGGFVSGSAVALWAWLAPLAARIVGHRRAALLLHAAFASGIVASAVFRPLTEIQNQLPDTVVVAFFVLNVIGVAVISFILIDASAGGREGTLASMRGMVRRYFSPDVIDAILADPARQELGGEIANVTILFADLGGYTTYAGSRPSGDVVDLLNAMFATAVPAILAEGGTPLQMPGDAVMAVFGAPRRQPTHTRSAARAALAIQSAGRALAPDHPDWPRFRIGLNSGDALVGNIGSDEFRNFTAIGDTVNMAQRFQTMAEPGQIVIGPLTADLLRPGADLAPLGERRVKGKSEPVQAFALLALRED